MSHASTSCFKKITNDFSISRFFSMLLKTLPFLQQNKLLHYGRIWNTMRTKKKSIWLKHKKANELFKAYETQWQEGREGKVSLDKIKLKLNPRFLENTASRWASLRYLSFSGMNEEIGEIVSFPRALYLMRMHWKW